MKTNVEVPSNVIFVPRSTPTKGSPPSVDRTQASTVSTYKDLGFIFYLTATTTLNIFFQVYVDIGNLASDTAQIQFSTNGELATRIWEIKVTQQPCDCNGPTDGCLQYHTGLTGRLTTFNFLPTNDNHLANQE